MPTFSEQTRAAGKALSAAGQAYAEEEEQAGRLGTCTRCGIRWPLSLLDGKPPSGAPALYSTRDANDKPVLHRTTFAAEEARVGQHLALAHAADAGADFTDLECPACYGPAWSEI